MSNTLPNPMINNTMTKQSIEEMHALLLQELTRLVEKSPERSEFMCRVGAQLSGEFRDILKKLGMRFNNFVACHSDRFEVTGYRSMKRMCVRQEENKAKEQSKPVSGVDELRLEIASILERHKRPILMSVVGSSMSDVGHMTLRDEGVKLKRFISQFPEFQLTSKCQGKELVTLTSQACPPNASGKMNVDMAKDFSKVPMEPPRSGFVRREIPQGRPQQSHGMHLNGHDLGELKGKGMKVVEPYRDIPKGYYSDQPQQRRGPSQMTLPVHRGKGGGKGPALPDYDHMYMQHRQQDMYDFAHPVRAQPPRFDHYDHFDRYGRDRDF
jgi:hypothetical protein